MIYSPCSFKKDSLLIKKRFMCLHFFYSNICSIPFMIVMDFLAFMSVYASLSLWPTIH